MKPKVQTLGEPVARERNDGQRCRGPREDPSAGLHQ